MRPLGACPKWKCQQTGECQGFIGVLECPYLPRKPMTRLDRLLLWEPEQYTLRAHVAWRWTGALLQDLARWVLRR